MILSGMVINFAVFHSESTEFSWIVVYCLIALKLHVDTPPIYASWLTETRMWADVATIQEGGGSRARSIPHGITSHLAVPTHGKLNYPAVLSTNLWKCNTIFS